MTNRQLLCAVALVVLAATIGCKNSAKAGQSTPTPSPTPAVAMPTARSSATPTPPPTVLVTPIHVTPPASFNADQLPPGRVQFAVSGRAGQVLLMKVREVPNAHYNYGTDQRYAVSVQLDANSSSPLDAIQKGGTCTDTALYALPQTGTYRVAFEPLPGEEHGIDFATIAPDDPLVDAGIKPEQISIDFGSLASKDEIRFVPLAMADGCLDEAWPSHLAVLNARLELRVMQVAGYKKVFPPERSMELLEAALQRRATDTKVIELPYATNGDAALEVSTRPQFLEGQGWHGLRWIGKYGQDTSCWFEESTYVFQGTSDNGRFFILMRANVAHPSVGRRLSQDCLAAVEKTPNKSIDDMFKKEMPALFDKEISAADPASFQPNLDQLDAVIKSLKLKP